MGRQFSTAVITGAGSGIGRALSQQLAKTGTQVFASDIDSQALEETVATAGTERENISAEPLDVSDQEGVKAYASRIVDLHGPPSLLINNAGIAFVGRTWELSVADFASLMGVNYWGVVHSTMAFLPAMRAANRGNIVNISSIFGIIGFPGMSAYNSSKFAVRGFSECLRLELDEANSGVKVTCVHPGGVATNIANASRLGSDLERSPDQSAMGAEFARRALTTPDQAARTILRAAAKDKRRVLVGLDAKVIDIVQRICPTAYQPLVLKVAKRTIDLM